MIQFLIAATEGAEAPNPILPEPVELIVGGIVFAIVFAVIWKLALPPLNAMLAARTDRIQGELERAEQTRRSAESELESYRAKIAGARAEADRIVDEARKAAEQLRRDATSRAEQEAASIVARAQDEIRAERDRAFQELRGQVGQIAVDLAGRVVGSTLDAKKHEQLIDAYIDEVAAGGARGAGR